LRRLASGRITNDEFDIAAVVASPDPAIGAIWDFGWGHYSDLGTYRLRGRHALTKPQLEAIARAVLFLDSDLPYEWPSLRPSLLEFFLLLGTLGLLIGHRRRRWQANGPIEVWPFFRVADHDAALATPRRLRGAA
jgi:hypothetical protein